MNKLNRRNFLKGLGLSGLGVGLFRFKPEEAIIDLPEVVELEFEADELPDDNLYQVNVPSYTLTTSSTGFSSGQIVYVGSNGTMTIIPNGIPIGVSTSDNAIMIKGSLYA